MKDCLFCKIAHKKENSYEIYEDEDVFAFLDINQKEYGHTLVVPKKHTKNLLTCPRPQLARLMFSVQKIARHYVQDCGFRSVKVFNLNGKESGQSIFHLHFHIVPIGDNIKGNRAESLSERMERLRFK